MVFAQRIFIDTKFPIELRASFKFNNETRNYLNLRSNNKLTVYKMEDTGTFYFFMSKIINEFCLQDLELNINKFSLKIFNNINLIFLKFVKLFINFDLAHKNFKKNTFNLQ